MEVSAMLATNRVSMGVRISIGGQKANRIQPENITTDAIQWSRELGFHSINLDLIYGLPHQTLKSFEETVVKVIGLSPDRLAVFHYAHVPWLKPHQKLIHDEHLPSPELKLEIFKMTTENLLQAGYWSIGMDHFAENDELALRKGTTLYRNFQGYSTQTGRDLYGFRMSAIGHFWETYHQKYKTLPEYYAAIEQRSWQRMGYRTRDTYPQGSHHEIDVHYEGTPGDRRNI
jgi:oxygen-independent coproporphyrinogen-3 oxidase